MTHQCEAPTEDDMASTRTRRGVIRAIIAGYGIGLSGCVRTPDAVSKRTDPDSGSGEPPTSSGKVRERARTVGETTRNAVVVLQSDESLRSGTGWFSENGYVVTNRHVVDRLGDVTCRTLGGTQFDAPAVSWEVADASAPDVAVLDPAIDPPAVLSSGSSRRVEPGQPVVQVGHTYVGYWVISLGRIVARRDRARGPVLLTEIPMMRGNSGSPLVTLAGDVIGLTIGVEPQPGRPPVQSPTPGPPTVFERYPRQAAQFGVHIPIETVNAVVARLVS